jgi:hypothetical protein
MMSYAEQLDAFGVTEEAPSCRKAMLRTAATVEIVFGAMSQEDADRYAAAAVASPGMIAIIEDQLFQDGLKRTAGLRAAY